MIDQLIESAKEALEKKMDWKKTGVCPACERRAVTGGRCIICGWVSEERSEREKRHRAWKEEWERLLLKEIDDDNFRLKK